MQLLAAKRLRALIVAMAGFVGFGVVGLVGASAAQAQPFINGFNDISTISSAVPTSGPSTGDVNPYGVAVVPRTHGDLKRGNVLVSNFNNAANLQGTGRSIVEITPGGMQHVFALVPPKGSTATGLTTALAALRNGDVIVGNLPAPDGDSTRMTAGALTVLNSNGNVIKTITAPDINGPWDMTAVDDGSNVVLFVTNVLNGTVAAHGDVVRDGTVVRLRIHFSPSGGDPDVTSNHVIASGFAEHTDPNALVVGPTGVGLGRDGVLYVADSNGNRIAWIPNALTRTTVLGGGGNTLSSGGALNDPLGLLVTPNGDVVSANGANGNVVEMNRAGSQVATKTLQTEGAGDLFGIALAPDAHGMYFVNDSGSGPAANSLQLLH
jgi:hypothetical protein